MRQGALVLACAGAFVIAGSAVSAPTTVSTRSCAPVGSSFNVQIAGNIGGTYWNWLHPDVFAPIPDEKSMVAVWGFGSQTNRGPMLRGWIAGDRSRISSRCRTSSDRAPERGNLRPRLKVEDGWAYGRRYECRQQGRFIVRTETLRNGIRMSVWMERGRELIAVAETGRGRTWLRVSRRCLERTL